MSNQTISVSLAILYQEGKFLMQLRDDIPGIRYPGCWGLFGGHLEPGETPEEALKRELLEEINYAVAAARKFHSYADGAIIRYIYHAPLTLPLDELKLNEGKDLGLVTKENVWRGSQYSHKADSVRLLVNIHRQILLDFIKVQSQEI